ncbi:MAG: hypothetical protein U1E76_14100 [Planctomycetota bacterium]
MMLVLLLAAVSMQSPPPADFWSYWGDGKAEVSTYKTVTSRYGEPRDGTSILIFVTEDFSRRARVKAESDATPKSDRVPVLKMNRLVKFVTGVYDYSVMTSVFSAVARELDHAPFQPLKISFSAQEWCGHVFQMLLPERKSVDLTVHSYFESEHDQRNTYALPQNFAFEDNLPIWIRELNGEVLKLNDRGEIALFPSAWQTRVLHQEPAFAAATIVKEDGETMTVLGNSTATWRITWHVGDRTETYWTEQAYPHRIVRWLSSDGGSGELKSTTRIAYWQMKRAADAPEREKLGLPR